MQMHKTRRSMLARGQKHERDRSAQRRRTQEWGSP